MKENIYKFFTSPAINSLIHGFIFLNSIPLSNYIFNENKSLLASLKSSTLEDKVLDSYEYPKIGILGVMTNGVLGSELVGLVTGQDPSNEGFITYLGICAITQAISYVISPKKFYNFNS